MEFTQQEVEFMLMLLNRVSVQGQEVESLAYIKNKIIQELNGSGENTKGNKDTKPATSKNGGAKSGS